MELQESSITYDNTSFKHYYLFHYLPLTAGIDERSRSLLKFKRRIQPHLRHWIDETLEVFTQIPLSPDTIILRALRHDELKIPIPTSPQPTNQTTTQTTPPTTQSALDLLCQTLADHYHCQYQPSLLQKSRPTLSNKGLTRHQRELELRNIYSITPTLSLPETVTHSPFLLVDDICTTGATLRAIIHTLQQTFPHNPIRIFTLAKADYSRTRPS